MNCRECGRGFTYEVPQGRSSTWLRLLKPQVCAACAPIVDARHAAEVIAREKAERQKERHDEWLELCPPIYRHTDPAKLPPGCDGAGLAAAAWPFGPQGLGLCGASGRGKTRLMFTLCTRMRVAGWRGR